MFSFSATRKVFPQPTLLLAQMPHDVRWIATFTGTNQPVLFQCLYGAGIRQKSADDFAVFQSGRIGLPPSESVSSS
jgi:hypothetical protein